jgi:hypothetical protein
MVTIILDKDEQNYGPREVEKDIQKIRKAWRKKIWNIEEDGTVRIIL